jgi:diguanylate cyclase (GGDEF)-like protein
LQSLEVGDDTMSTSLPATTPQAPSGGANRSDDLRRILTGGYNLPIPPVVLLRLMGLGKDPNADPDDYAEVISASNSLSAKILSCVNSSWFGVRQTIRKVSQAVNMLGMVSVRVLAITHCMAAIHERFRLSEQISKRYWQASLVKAEAGRFLAEHTDPAAADEAFLVGLMQDMVLPLMHRLQNGPYEQLLDAGPMAPAEMCAMERDLFGMDHGQASAILGQTIGLPTSLCEVIGHHHDQSALTDLCDSPGLARAVHFAGLFPHVCTDWAAAEAAAAAEVIGQGIDDIGGVDQALREIGDRVRQLSAIANSVDVEELDLPGLLADATNEIAQTTTSLVGQVHSLMCNTTQVTSQLSAINAEALRLEEQTQTDGLTGVLNRLGLEQAGPHVIAQIRHRHESLMLAFADLDGFKAVNDRFGHDTGDEALKMVAMALQDVFGPAAVVGRYGGDEFVVLLGGVTDCERANVLGRTVLTAIAGGVLDEDDTPVPIGLSMGGIWCPVVSETADFRKMLVVADELMYAAKAVDAESVQIKTMMG